MKFKTFYNLYSLQKRVLIIVISIILLFFALFCRLFYLQIINGKHLQVLAAEEWLRDLPLSSKRGEILDCNGVSLATTVTTYDVSEQQTRIVVGIIFAIPIVIRDESKALKGQYKNIIFFSILIMELAEENLIACHHSMDEIAELIGVDTLGYLPVEKLDRLVESKHYCAACFNGEYPTQIPVDLRKDRFERKLSERV